MMRLKSIAHLVFVGIVVFLIGSASGFAQSSEQVNITGDLFEIDQQSKTATFTGNVYAKQKTFQLWAPRLIASYGEGGPSDLKKVTADGRIRVEFGNQKAIADRGIYDPSTKSLTLIGNVSTSQTGSNDVINSNEMIIDLSTNTTRFEGGGKNNGRVTATFGSGN
ncbi:LptA/OstA family protein [Maritalea porphyrae]|jgi:lipopolysaccharide export system protein LptA|uniref:LptA/OstA family protein n=1 Tax=Maritalea porphyrae TaxID=880732 RepID=UPI0022AEA4AB|nr:LptA/OstA family protein [Maritalea porphyrae]MCZ4271959.1 hypothetical protein [Maritalea porphyrae]